jgi:hypothetical protein
VFQNRALRNEEVHLTCVGRNIRSRKCRTRHAATIGVSESVNTTVKVGEEVNVVLLGVAVKLQDQKTLVVMVSLKPRLSEVVMAAEAALESGCARHLVEFKVSDGLLGREKRD